MFQPPEELDLDHQSVESGYALWSRTYDEMLTDTVDGDILRAFLKELPDLNGKSVLDFGCGTGRNIQWLQEHGAHVNAVGVDISKDMLSHARQKNIYEQLFEESLPELNQEFDLVLSVLTACHVEDLTELYAYFWKHLKAGGHIVLVDMHPHMFHVGKGTYVPVEDRKIYIQNYVHEINAHIKAGNACACNLLSIEESFVPAEWASKSTNYGDLTGHPLGVGYLWQK